MTKHKGNKIYDVATYFKKSTLYIDLLNVICCNKNVALNIEKNHRHFPSVFGMILGIACANEDKILSMGDHTYSDHAEKSIKNPIDFSIEEMDVNETSISDDVLYKCVDDIISLQIINSMGLDMLTEAINNKSLHISSNENNRISLLNEISIIKINEIILYLVSNGVDRDKINFFAKMNRIPEIT